MLKHLLSLSLFIFSCLQGIAGTVIGKVTDKEGNPLPYASVTIKGGTRGVNANSVGVYTFTLNDGTYTLICQYVGYTKVEKQVTVSGNTQTVDFELAVQGLTMDEVIIEKGEDPAYEIIRNAIKKRDYYNDRVDSFEVNVYIKGIMRSRKIPEKILGKKVERSENDGLDSAGKGILFLSESLTKVSYAKPNKIKLDVISARQSGGDGFGLSIPFFINFYESNVNLFSSNLNPRGFVSPIANGALNFYRYKYEGFFMEDGKMINTIKVIPRRKGEPVFSGTIHIVEEEWSIHSLDLVATKAYQLELADSLQIKQLHGVVESDVWKTKTQVVDLTMKILGFDVAGNFVNVYSDYNINPGFEKKYFGKILMKYDTASNKRDTGYWNAMRPVPLEPDETRDYIFKDSVAKVEKDSALTRSTLDSLNKPVKFKGSNLLWGSGVSKWGHKKTVVWNYKLKSLLPQLQYNSVEGISLNVNQQLQVTPRKSALAYQLDWNTRYGFMNSHLNSFAALKLYNQRKQNFDRQELTLSGGKRLSQFNPDNPIDRWTNAFYTLLLNRNYMKLYENWFGNLKWEQGLENGFSYKLHATYEDRLTLENSTKFSLFNKSDELLPNHPYELAHIPFNRHQAVIVGFSLRWQPGQRYIQYPTYKMPIGSKKPVFELEYNKGIAALLGSDVDYDKWKVSMSHNMNLKLGGEFKYKIAAGGFLNNHSVSIPDLQHFNGNRTFYNVKYLNSFMLAPYYQYSNAENLYGLAHVEHHFNGLLTNKIPLLNTLKWNLVVGGNTFFVNKNNYYVEVFAGLENIFKVIRVDVVNAYQPIGGNNIGVRVGLGGIIGSNIRFE